MYLEVISVAGGHPEYLIRTSIVKRKRSCVNLELPGIANSFGINTCNNIAYCYLASSLSRADNAGDDAQSRGENGTQSAQHQDERAGKQLKRNPLDRGSLITKNGPGRGVSRGISVGKDRRPKEFNLRSDGVRGTVVRFSWARSAGRQSRHGFAHRLTART
jgi:hypothetical protein